MNWPIRSMRCHAIAAIAAACVATADLPSRRRVTIRIVRSAYWSPLRPGARPTSSLAV